MITQGPQEPVVGSVTPGLLGDEMANVGVAVGVSDGEIVGVGVGELD
jgi:hypothetical protein